MCGTCRGRALEGPLHRGRLPRPLGRRQGEWRRFTHHDKHHIERPLGQGVVMERKKREALQGARLPAAFYDVSAL